MLKLLGIVYLVVSLIGSVLLMMVAVRTLMPWGIALAIGSFFSAFLVPALLFALSDIVAATQETARGMKALVDGAPERDERPAPIVYR